MKELVRRSIAYAAGLQIADRRAQIVLSRQGRDRSRMSEDLDERTGCRLSAMRTRRLLVHDPDTRILFDHHGSRFSGWVEQSGQRYSGKVSGDVVTIYDNAVGAHFRYQLE
ncbi:hypothetical protein [Aureimonas leprariae]|uniref:Uncharacterized protein n=1 Tax=Plantimonas leprariae TaxID=2615207 RepID=A0A7V7TUL8_9HYPH|nr:hypothetical protein [Aureimonas leprariae]KAB0676190.1 hypothetical protein F6X38_21845 [Aureimonas leprariae]